MDWCFAFFWSNSGETFTFFELTYISFTRDIYIYIYIYTDLNLSIDLCVNGFSRPTPTTIKPDHCRMTGPF